MSNVLLQVASMVRKDGTAIDPSELSHASAERKFAAAPETEWAALPDKDFGDKNTVEWILTNVVPGDWVYRGKVFYTDAEDEPVDVSAELSVPRSDPTATMTAQLQ